MGVEKTNLKEQAIALRRAGRTYSEILAVIPVAKSTISLWLHSVHLAKHQKQRITLKRVAGQAKGALARRSQRQKLQKDIWSSAQKEVGELSKRELWLIGIALYWAEGSKEKEYHPGSRMRFSNSDPRMIRIFIAWIKMFGETENKEITFGIYIHDNKRESLPNVINFWSKETGFPQSYFGNIYFKRDKINSKRKNRDLLYNGLLQVNIPKSSRLLRKIEGWVRGIDGYCRIV